MIVYRLTKKSYKDTLSGKGAELHGGRWNSKGTSIIYTGESRALCTAEIAVHVPLGILPHNYYLQTIEIPESPYKTVLPGSLSKNWNTFPHIPETKKWGDQLAQQNNDLILRVPSAVIQGDYNILINTGHPQFTDIKLAKIEPFAFDKRLFLKK